MCGADPWDLCGQSQQVWGARVSGLSSVTSSTLRGGRRSDLGYRDLVLAGVECSKLPGLLGGDRIAVELRRNLLEK